MKKIKWILLFITFIMMAFFLFATCKKTKAYTYTYSTPLLYESYVLSNGEGFSYIMNSDFSTDTFVFSLKDGNTVVYLLDIYPSSGNTILAIYNRQGSVEATFNLSSLSSSNLLYMQFLYDYDLDELYLYISPIIFTLQNRQDDSAIISNVGLSSNGFMFEITDNLFITNYTSSQSSASIDLYYSAYPSDSLIGFQQLYMFNIVNQFSEDIYEQLDLIWTDLSSTIPINYYNSLIDTVYYSGYNAGYTAGQTDGYNAGYSAGYTAGEGEGYRYGYDTGYDDGYDAGLRAGYNNGYAAGLADNAAGQTEAYNAGYGQGRHDGYVEGYDRGYNLGYDDGFTNGMSGATPVSQTIGVVSSIFAGVGTVLSVELFPGFPLGLLILVPLFFAVLGLILWIWRRN